MANTLNVGIIGCEMSEEIKLASGAIGVGKFSLMKILAKDKATAGIAQITYPQAIIVDDITDIINDPAIELVFISSQRKYLPMVREVLKARKHVRVI